MAHTAKLAVQCWFGQFWQAKGFVALFHGMEPALQRCELAGSVFNGLWTTCLVGRRRSLAAAVVPLATGVGNTANDENLPLYVHVVVLSHASLHIVFVPWPAFYMWEFACFTCFACCLFQYRIHHISAPFGQLALNCNGAYLLVHGHVQLSDFNQLQHPWKMSLIQENCRPCFQP
jgi:hypothetical protein